MSFVHPSFLYALGALAIPILIHLFNFRRYKRIYFTNVHLLQEVKEETQDQNRLKHLLVLLMRLLALAFLVFCFAQPYLPQEEAQYSGSRRAISIFIDNSFSMEGETQGGDLLEVAKNRAIDIANSYGPADRFQLLTQDFEGRHQRLVSRESFIDLVQEVRISPRSRSLAEIYSRQSDLLATSDRAALSYVISDFQKAPINLLAISRDSSVSRNLVLLERSSPANLYLDSAWFESPVRKAGAAEKLRVRVVNTGSEAVADVPLKLLINGEQRAIGSVAIPAQAHTDTVLSFVNGAPGLQLAEVQLDDSPVVFDDRYYFSFPVYNSIRVLSITDNPADSSGYHSAVYQPDSAYVYTSSALTEVNYNQLNTWDFVILNEVQRIPSGLAQSLFSFMKNGGTLWLIPAPQADLSTYNALLQLGNLGQLSAALTGSYRVRKIETAHPLYQGIFTKIPANMDLPEVAAYHPYRPGTGGELPLLSLGNGAPFLVEIPVAKGRLYLQTAALSLSGNTFARHALFVASALRMAEVSKAVGLTAVKLGESFNLPAAGSGDAMPRLAQASGALEIIPEVNRAAGQLQIRPGPEVTEAGNYLVLQGADTLGASGINYTRAESELHSYTLEELKPEAATRGIALYNGNATDLQRVLQQAATGKELWKICLLLALLFLLGETLLLRFWKTHKA